MAVLHKAAVAFGQYHTAESPAAERQRCFSSRAASSFHSAMKRRMIEPGARVQAL